MAYDLCFAKRPAEELYDLRKDPDQLVNLAGNPEYAGKLAALGGQLTRELADSGDPRHSGEPFDFDAVPYIGGAPKYPGAGKAKK